MSAAPDFDWMARPYRWLEYLTFGPFLWRCRVRWLPQLGGCRSALVLGDGDGRFTAALLRSNPQIRVHAADLSPRMLVSLKQAAKENIGRVTTEIADLRVSRPDEGASYDLIVSHFFLDCLTTGEVADLALRLAPWVAPNALWVVSDFAIPATLFGKLVARPLVAGLYLAFRWLTGLRQRSLPDHAPALAAAGWRLQDEDRQLGGLLFSQIWQRPTILGRRPSELE